MGRGKALRLFCLGEPLPASEAEACGLFTKVFPKAQFADSFDNEVHKLAALPFEVKYLLPLGEWHCTVLYCS
jgi:enoyl-CoA hydratase/carnithine racemase